MTHEAVLNVNLLACRNRLGRDRERDLRHGLFRPADLSCLHLGRQLLLDLGRPARQIPLGVTHGLGLDGHSVVEMALPSPACAVIERRLVCSPSRSAVYEMIDHLQDPGSERAFTANSPRLGAAVEHLRADMPGLGRQLGDNWDLLFEAYYQQLRDLVTQRNAVTEESLARVQAMASELKTLRATDSGSSELNMNRLINVTTGEVGIRPSRIQPNSRGEPQIRFENVGFAELLRWMIQSGHRVAEFGGHEATLEDVFLRVTKGRVQ